MQGVKLLSRRCRKRKAIPRRCTGSGDLGVITQQGMFENPAFEEALWALPSVGAVSAPVQMPSGFHVVRLDKVGQPSGSPGRLAEVREAIRRTYASKRLKSQFYEMSQTLTLMWAMNIQIVWKPLLLP